MTKKLKVTEKHKMAEKLKMAKNGHSSAKSNTNSQLRHGQFWSYSRSAPEHSFCTQNMPIWHSVSQCVPEIKVGHNVCVISDLGEEFRAEPTDLEADEGFTTILPCGPPEGYPRPMVTWKRDGEYVNLDQRIHISGEENSGNLIIQRVYKEDEGKYQCIVSNMAGSRESNSARLHVRRKSIFRIILADF